MEPNDADLRAQARALYEKSKARGLHNYDERGKGPRKASLILSAWYVRLHPDKNASILAAAEDAGIAPGTASSWAHRDKRLSDHLDMILKRKNDEPHTTRDLTDSDYAIVTKAFGIDDVLDAVIAAALGRDVDWSFYGELPSATLQLLADGGHPTLASLQKYAASLTSQSAPA